MDSRFVPVGTAALVLLLLPLGYQLYTSTSLTPPRVGDIKTEVVATNTSPLAVPKPGQGQLALPADKPAPTPPVAAIGGKAGEPQTGTVPMIGDGAKDVGAASNQVRQEGRDSLAAASTTPSPQRADLDALKPVPAPAPVMEKPSPPTDSFRKQATLVQAANAPAAASAGAVTSGVVAPLPAAPASVASGMAMDEMAAPAISARAATPPTGDTFAKFAESPLKAVATDPVSTFSIDVDTASYSYVRRSLNEGRIPEPDAVRIEEMVNYFPYDYPAAASADTPFKPTISVFPTPWNAKTELMQIGIKGFVPPPGARKAANLVFLVDTSGSMDEPDKLPLLQRALGLLVNTMSANDTVSIVAYAGSAGVVLEPTKATNRAKILSALNNLSAGGSTAGAEGIELAYQLAEQHKGDGNNRVILATDGDFNVGISDPEALKSFIKGKRASGIGLSVLGFGEGNLDDQTMQALAQNGDGNASYIDSLSEAQKVLVKEAGSTLDTIAKDVKIQIEFNPAMVSSYRLIGYETRALNREDFNNDRIDAGDVGEGHTVTALYEITPAGTDAAPPVDPLRYGPASPAAVATTTAPADGKGQELADFKLRYKLPGSDTSKLIEQPVGAAMVVDSIGKASNDARWAAAVAAFGQKLRGSDYAGAMSYSAIHQLAQGARGVDPDGYRSEFIKLVDLAGALSGVDPTPLQPVDGPQPPIVN